MKNIVVAGGGPAGLYVAHLLADEGFDVLLLDKRQAIGEHVICTGIVSKEAFDRFAFSPASILTEIQKLRLVSPGKTSLDYTHPEVLAYAVDRNKFDNHIRERAQKSGAEIRLQSTVRQVRVERNHVQISVKSPGKDYEVQAALLIIATGVCSDLQRQLGLGVPTDYLKAAQAHLPMERGGPTTVYVGQKVAPGGFAWVVPVREGLCRVGLMTAGRVHQHFDAILKRLDGAIEGKRVKVHFKPIVQGLVSRTYADRVLAVGEAAGQVKTTTGGGIYYGLLGAEIAAEVVVQGLERGHASAVSLRDYDRRWKRLMGREIELGCWARRLASRLSDNQVERLIRVVQSDGFFSFTEKYGRFDWHREAIFYLLRMPAVRNILSATTRHLWVA